MDVDTGIKGMARRCYGYGRWDAPYWFIGLGEGMTPGTSIQTRVEAWRHHSRETGLSDCRAFHEHIGETRFHAGPPDLLYQGDC